MERFSHYCLSRPADEEKLKAAFVCRFRNKIKEINSWQYQFSKSCANPQQKMDHATVDSEDLNCPCRELSNGDLGIVVTLLVCWQIYFLSARIGRQIQLCTKYFSSPAGVSRTRRLAGAAHYSGGGAAARGHVGSSICVKLLRDARSIKTMVFAELPLASLNLDQHLAVTVWRLF